MTRDQGYVEHRPHPRLARHVDALWTSTGARGELRVLPDGCADVLFDLSSEPAPHAFVVGPMTRAEIVPAQAAARCVAVRFKPAAAAAFLGVAMNELTDAHVDLEQLWRDGGEIEERVASSREPLRELERVLLERLDDCAPLDARIASVVARIERDPAATSVERLASECGVTRQYLTREFRQQVGLGPKMLARVLRAQRALSSLRERRKLADVALDAGYCDQAHMSGEFRALCGIAPAAWRRSERGIDRPAPTAA